MVKITKTSVLDLFNKGLNVEEMSTELTKMADTKISVTDVRKIAKGFDINLRSKPRKSRFTLVDDGNNANLNLTGSITLTGNITGSKNLTVESIDLLGVGATTFISDTNLNLSASNAVVVKSPIFRLTPTTTSSAESTAQNGDIIYDSNQNKFFGRANGVWVAFH